MLMFSLLLCLHNYPTLVRWRLHFCYEDNNWRMPFCALKSASRTLARLQGHPTIVSHGRNLQVPSHALVITLTPELVPSFSEKLCEYGQVAWREAGGIHFWAISAHLHQLLELRYHH